MKNQSLLKLSKEETEKGLKTFEKKGIKLTQKQKESVVNLLSKTSETVETVSNEVVGTLSLFIFLNKINSNTELTV